jgi:hypothetical protein
MNGSQPAPAGGNVTPISSAPGHGSEAKAVNAELTADRKRRKDDTEFDAFARRIIRAYAKRAGEGDAYVLSRLVRLQEEIDTVALDAVRTLKERGFSWAEIGFDTGLSRQGAYRRWGKSEESGS